MKILSILGFMVGITFCADQIPVSPEQQMKAYQNYQKHLQQNGQGNILCLSTASRMDFKMFLQTHRALLGIPLDMQTYDSLVASIKSDMHSNHPIWMYMPKSESDQLIDTMYLKPAEKNSQHFNTCKIIPDQARQKNMLRLCSITIVSYMKNIRIMLPAFDYSMNLKKN